MIFLLGCALVLNFVISWANAAYVGRYWSESKQVGGSLRAYIIAGYVMAVAGFTEVYGYLLIIIAPFILQFTNVSHEVITTFEQLSSDLLYLFCVLTIIPTGFFIWIRSLKKFWEEKTLGNGLVAGWNSFAQISNTVSASRNAPSAFGRVVKALFGGKGSKKKDTMVASLAILVVILALFGGYFTASAIMKKADAENDVFAEIVAKKKIQNEC